MIPLDSVPAGWIVASAPSTAPLPARKALFKQAIMKLRLTPSAYQQSAGLSKVFFGETALAAGFIDEIDLPERVLGRAQ